MDRVLLPTTALPARLVTLSCLALALASPGASSQLPLAHTQQQQALTNEAPRVNVKVSTSMVEQSSNTNTNNYNYNNNAQANSWVPQIGASSHWLAGTTPTNRLQRSTQVIVSNQQQQQQQQQNILTINSRSLGSQQVQFKPQDALGLDNGLFTRATTYPSDQLTVVPSSDFNIRGRIREHPAYTQSTSTSLNISPAPSSYLARQAQQAPFEQQQKANLTAGFEDQGRGQQSELDYKCQRRGLVKILKSAKNLLTDGFFPLERSATPSNLMLGSSLLAAAIPLVIYVLPDSRKRHVSNSADERQQGLSLAAGPRFNLQGRVDSVMGWIERSVEHLPNFPRLHPQECVKRSICEAHNEPDKYGAIGFMLRLLFPATNLSITDRMDNMEYKVINKYRHAAGFGLARRMESVNGTLGGSNSAAACKEKYEDCLVSLLDVAQNLIDVFLS